VDIGTAAGVRDGNIVAEGRFEDLLDSKEWLTFDYLNLSQSNSQARRPEHCRKLKDFVD